MQSRTVNERTADATQRQAPEASSARAPLIVHVIHELGLGGLENGLVNLINRMPPTRYRHAIVCMTRSTDFSRRLRRDDVDVYAMQRDQAPLSRTLINLYGLLRRLRPAIVHSRNRSGLDALLPSLCAGVRVRVHGEHGRDVDDLDGSNRRYRLLRQLFRPLVSQYTAVSKDLENYLVERIGVPAHRVCQIYNGVDTDLFRPRAASAHAVSLLAGQEFHGHFVVGTVGRLQPVKDQVTLIRAFGLAKREAPERMVRARLVIVGEGPSRQIIEAAILEAGLGDSVYLSGARDDVPDVLRSFDVFVLPSLAEGISNTLLEAMATGLPVLTTRVGGNPELVVDGETGWLVGARDSRALAAHLIGYASDAQVRRRHGEAARRRALASFSLQSMVERYTQLYDMLLAARSVPASASGLSSGSKI